MQTGIEISNLGQCQCLAEANAAGTVQHQPCPDLIQPARALWAPQGSFQSPADARGLTAKVLPPLPESELSAVRQRARLRTLHLPGQEQLGQEDSDEEEQQQAYSCKEQLRLPPGLEVYSLEILQDVSTFRHASACKYKTAETLYSCMLRQIVTVRLIELCCLPLISSYGHAFPANPNSVPPCYSIQRIE